MIFSKKFIGILLVLITNYCYCFTSVNKPTLIDQLRWDFLTLEIALWGSSNGHVTNETNLVRNLYDFDQQLQNIPIDIIQNAQILPSIPNFLYLYPELLNIDNIYEKFREYQNGYLSRKEDGMLIESINYDILNNRSGAIETMKKIYEYTGVYGEDSDSVIEQLEKILSQNFGCNKIKQSPQQVMYNFYNIIAIRDLKAYIMEQFVYLVNRLYEKDNDNEIANIARRKFKARTKALIKRMSLKWPNDIWKCDPEYHARGKTYDEFTRLLQGHIQNEVDMNSKGTCTKTCNDYYFTQSTGCYDSSSDYCRKMEKCNGNIIGCFYIEKASTVCLSNSPNRRYEYIRFKSGYTYGRNKHCTNQKSVNSWTRWFVRCAYCMCLCDETSPKSDRYISLRPVKSDIEHNRVVTGIRLVKHNRILHLQIQQGKLLPYGYIDQSTVDWVPLDDYKITNKDVAEGTDFIVMHFTNRTMAMDELQTHEPNRIITGVRFEYINGKIYFEIHISPFDWKNGTVSPDSGYFIYGTTHHSTRETIVLNNADVPTMAGGQSIKVDGEYQVKFTHSSFEKDAAQTTVPFIDIQQVTSEPAVPLIGAGIFYKLRESYGGYIAPIIKTYDYNKHISNKMPDTPEDIAEMLVN